MLSVVGLRKGFGERVAVDEVGFEISGGEIFGLLGPNGAGKTTTISMVAGILARDAGTVVVDGIDLDEGAAARARIGLVPQEITLYRDLTGRENLRFWGRLYDLRGDELASAVEDGLGAVGLADRGDDFVGEYSGGMQRRLNIAAGILHDPHLIVLDEPTVGVDPQSRNAIFELVERLRDAGKALLYTTHYMEEAERLCSRIGIIDAGRIIAEGTRDALVSQLDEAMRIELAFAEAETLEAAIRVAAVLPGAADVQRVDGRLHVFPDATSGPGSGTRLLPQLLDVLLDRDMPPNRVEFVEPDLEDVFLRLTGKALRD